MWNDLAKARAAAQSPWQNTMLGFVDDFISLSFPFMHFCFDMLPIGKVNFQLGEGARRHTVTTT